jgi:hypothetical protein
MTEPKDNFLARWSQRKVQARETGRVAPPPAPTEPGAAELAELPPLESLTPDSDFSAFLRPDVDPVLRRAALSKLFSDPRFNTLDGLDTYIGDYTLADPLPEGMLEKLAHWQNILATQSPPKEVAGEAAPLPAPEAPLQVTDAATRHAAPAPEPVAVSRTEEGKQAS